jgi:hypothetical protein
VAVQRGAMTPTPRGTSYLIVSREARPPIRMLCPCCRRYKTRPLYFILPFFFSSSLLSSSTSPFSLKMKYFSSFQEDFCLFLDSSKIWTSASRIIPNGISDHNKRNDIFVAACLLFCLPCWMDIAVYEYKIC